VVSLEHALASPGDARLWCRKGYALAREERAGEAVEAFDRSVELDPGSGRTWYERGLALMEMSRYDEAADSLEGRWRRAGMPVSITSGPRRLPPGTV